MPLTIGTNSTILRLLNSMSNLEAQRANTMTRIATGKRINRASDDPAGLVALNSLNSELASVNASLDNNSRSQSMLNVVDSTLTEINTLVGDVQDLVLKASGAGVSAAEKAAYQAQIDESVESIDRLVNSASFNGKYLFNGEHRITATTNSTPSIKDLHVYRRNPSITGSLSLSVAVTAAAKRGSAVTTYGIAATLSTDTVIQVTGKLGTATIELASGTNGTNLMAAIAAQKNVTGVSAAAQGANVALMSTTTGTDAFVSLQVLDGSRTLMNLATTDKTIGTDATVTVNNQAASAQGTEVFYNGGGVSLSFNLAKNATNPNLNVTIVGSGAEFQLDDSTNGRVAVGIAGVNTVELGRSDVGYLSDIKSGGSHALTVSGNDAAEIASLAASRVATMAARIGSFNKFQVGAAISTLQGAKEGLSASIEDIGDADYAADSAMLERQSVLMNAAVSMMSLANSQYSTVLSLLLR